MQTPGLIAHPYLVAFDNAGRMIERAELVLIDLTELPAHIVAFRSRLLKQGHAPVRIVADLAISEG